MSFWKFTSDSKWFTLELPDNWSEYDGEDEGTYGFFDTTEWSGNLRVTPFRLNGENDGEDRVYKAVNDELSNNPDAVLMKINKWDAAFYKQQIDEETSSYYWVTGSNNKLFLFSFAFDNIALSTQKHQEAMQTVTEILNSTRLVD